MLRLLFILLFTCITAIGFSQKLPTQYYRAQAAIENNNLLLASKFIDSSIAANPRNPLLLLKKGEIEFRKTNFAEAVESFYAAESIRNGIASYWLARTYAMQADTVNAFLELERHLGTTPKEIEASILLDTAFNKIKNTTQWRKLWLNDWYSPNERLLADIAYNLSREDWEIAIDILNNRMHGRKTRHQLYALRGEAYFNSGSFRAAESDFAQALKRSRRNHQYMAWHARTLIALNKGKMAIRTITNAIELSGGEPAYYKLRATAFASNQNYSSAIDDIKYYLTFYPNCLEAISQLAEYSIESGRLIEALFQLGKLINEKPNEWRYYHLRGKIYMSYNNWEMAEIDINQAIKLNSKNAESFLNRGICRVNLKKSSEACDDFREAIRLGSFQAQEMQYMHCRK